MPRHLDYDQRRELIAQAVCAIVADHGVAGASLRAVAARAGVSMSAVQRCFATTAEMIAFALDQLNNRIGARVQAAVDAVPVVSEGVPSARALLVAAAREIALLEVEVETARMWLAFHASAAEPAVAERLRTDEAAVLATVTGMIVYGRQTGELPPGTDSAAEAELLVATLDGVAAQLALGVIDHGTARDIIDRAIMPLYDLHPRNAESRMA